MRRLKKNIGLVLALLFFLTGVKPVPAGAAAKGSDISAGDLPGSQIYATISGNNYGVEIEDAADWQAGCANRGYLCIREMPQKYHVYCQGCGM